MIGKKDLGNGFCIFEWDGTRDYLVKVRSNTPLPVLAEIYIFWSEQGGCSIWIWKKLTVVLDLLIVFDRLFQF